jgi:predicted membrane channel-forming protein YqfA (hemolysin III family)
MTVAGRFFHICVLILLLGTLFPTEVQAYLDPGTGSLFIQGLIATVAAAGYSVLAYWTRIRQWFRRPRGKAPEVA